MARQAKAPRTSAAPGDDYVRSADDPSLSDMLAQARHHTPIGQEHGALEAIQTSLTELKNRAASVAPHMNKRYAAILERIQSL